MPVRIRLQRHGKKGKPFYWIVAADGRAKRDGRYLEKIGTYNPNTNPATVELDVDQAVKWLENGAQPSDTARTLLSYRGVMMKHHLNGGVKKGSFSQQEADKRFLAWLDEKQSKIKAKIDSLDKDKVTDLAQRFEAEKAVNQKRIADLSAAHEVEEDDTAGSDIETLTEEVATAANETLSEAETVEEVPADDTPAAKDPKDEEVPVVDESINDEIADEATKNDEASEEEAKSEDAPAKEEETK
jgi:small subunit ribosomal protein S16